MTKILIQSAQILDSASPFNGQTKSILIENGIITQIADQISIQADLTIDQPNLKVSTGWVDMRVSAPDPGYEYRESLRSVREAAATGGFTEITLLPNTQPVIQTKESVSYLTHTGSNHAVKIHPIAAVTIDVHGKDLTEMMDLHQAGVIAFSDGHEPLQNSDMVLKVLQYLQPFGGLFINRPEDTLLTKFGTMNEGLPATMLGMKGMPRMAESMMIMRDLRILEYTGGKIHFTCISTAESVELIRQAKQKGLQVTCDIAAHQIAFTDGDLMEFDTNLKVNPPFRGQSDIDALWIGLADGTIDAIVSDHHPLDVEVKNLEFDLASFGIIGLETAFAVLNTYNTKLPTEQLVRLLSKQPRHILGLPTISISENQPANLTLFDTDTEWTFTEKDIRSLSKNTPFIGKNFKGKVWGVINQGQAKLVRQNSEIRNSK
ncbi:dihydroorotase [Cytophagaceae bacterium YF14B1]|uniref:Dihydroorotase n=1 Tax=Xanthocytophaga flava TaxID=3048013 RepID=A0AAE3U9M7_9BACT|nr:dihydroorotase [Xanthocytophaga flavus]MDJ1481894.1 dihydroorotase [Xanthocytophaga flavus]